MSKLHFLMQHVMCHLSTSCATLSSTQQLLNKTLTRGRQSSLKYETQSGANLPESVATLLNKTTGAFQQHLRLNARTLTTYAQMRAVIVEYFRGQHILHSSSSSQGPAVTDMGYVGKGKGKKGKLLNSSRAKLAMKGLRKGKGKNPHWNFHTKAKGKGIGHIFWKRQKNSGSRQGELRFRYKFEYFGAEPRWKR